LTAGREPLKQTVDRIIRAHTPVITSSFYEEMLGKIIAAVKNAGETQ
jgi:hypothetical protein